MRRGSLVLVLQHALDPSLLSKPVHNSSRSNQLSASSSLVASHHSNYNNKSAACFLRCTRSAYTSTSFSSFVFTSLSRCHARLPEDYGGRNFPGFYWLNDWREDCKIVRKLSWSTRGFESGRYRPQGCHARAALATMSSANGGPPEGYRPNVGLCLVNEKNEVFVASRLDVPDSWQMPQGGVGDGEEPRNAAIRELREETGVTSVELIGEVQEWLTYDFPPDVKTKITALWGREWTGQAQKWFLFRFNGDDNEVNLASDGTEPAEFGSWKWLPAEDVLKGVVEFKKPVYAHTFKSLAMYIDSWSKF